MPQRERDGDNRVLYLSGAHGTVLYIDKTLGHREIGKALTQVDSAVLGGKLRHNGEDGGAVVGKLALHRARIGGGGRMSVRGGG